MEDLPSRCTALGNGIPSCFIQSNTCLTVCSSANLWKTRAIASPDLTIGILLNPIILSLQIADRYRTKQLSTPSLLPSSGKRPLPEERQFHLAHSSLHAEHHSIVGHTRIVHLLLVDNECSNHSAEL